MRPLIALLVATGCGATQLGVANYEDPRTNDAPHRHNDDTITLPDDEAAVTEVRVQRARG